MGHATLLLACSTRRARGQACLLPRARAHARPLNPCASAAQLQRTPMPVPTRRAPLSCAAHDLIAAYEQRPRNHGGAGDEAGDRRNEGPRRHDARGPRGVGQRLPWPKNAEQALGDQVAAPPDAASKPPELPQTSRRSRCGRGGRRGGRREGDAEGDAEGDVGEVLQRPTRRGSAASRPPPLPPPINHSRAADVPIRSLRQEPEERPLTLALGNTVPPLLALAVGSAVQRRSGASGFAEPEAIPLEASTWVAVAGRRAAAAARRAPIMERGGGGRSRAARSCVLARQSREGEREPRDAETRDARAA